MHLPLTFLERCYTFTSLHLWCQQLLFRIWCFLNFWEKGKHVMLSSQEVLTPASGPGLLPTDVLDQTRLVPVYQASSMDLWPERSQGCAQMGPARGWRLCCVVLKVLIYEQRACILCPRAHKPRSYPAVAATNKFLNEWSKCHFRITCWDQAPTLRQAAC